MANPYTPGEESEGSGLAGSFETGVPCRDYYSDVERAPSDTPNKEDGWFYETNVSTLADEYAGQGWVQRTRPLGSKGNPLKTSGTAGAVDNKEIDRYNEAATSVPVTGSG